MQAADRMSLSIGVALTGEQVVALTHDIVWMETTEVNCIEVLAPVFYIAQLKETNIASNGSICSGQLISLNALSESLSIKLYCHQHLA